MGALPSAHSLLPLALALAACHAAPATTSDTSAPSASTSASAPAAPSSSPSGSPSSAPAAGPDFAPSAPSSIPALSPRGLRERKADLDRHAHEIDQQLGPSHGPVRVEDDTFLLVAPEPGAWVLDDAVKITHDTIAALSHGPLGHANESAYIVWVFQLPANYGPFLEYRSPGADPKDLGYIDYDTGEIFVCTGPGGMGSLAHEITHALLLADAPHLPYGLQEGIASQFEDPSFDPPGEIHGKAHFRLQTLRTQLARPDWASRITLDALFHLTPDSFQGKGGYIAAALARESMRWLDSQHLMWRFYHQVRDNILKDPDGTAAWMAVVGKSPQEATPDWIAWLKSPEAEQP